MKQRPTAKFLADLKAAGFTQICWVVAERDAHGYERDEHEMVVYPDRWAEEYAASHWMNTTPYEPGTFYGAFVGREYACLEAERRGCWGVLQLDDNIVRLVLAKSSIAGDRVVQDNGGMGLFADLLAAVTLATNGRMVGAHLTSANKEKVQLARTGFPYSCFIEQVGEGREHWYGPFEDDITHAFQYGTRYDGATALVLPMLRYQKESKSKTGMRGKYNHERSVNLHRIFPESAKVTAMATKSNGRRGEDNERVFHKMKAGAIRNPLLVHEREMYVGARDELARILRDFLRGQAEGNADKVRKRAR